MTPAEWATSLMAGACYCRIHKDGQSASWSGNRCGGCVRIAIERAVDEAYERAANVIKDVVDSHRTLTGHNGKRMCEDFGCADLVSIAAEIRALKGQP